MRNPWRRRRSLAPVESAPLTEAQQDEIVVGAAVDARTLGVKSCEQLGWVFDRDGVFRVANKRVGSTTRLERKPSKDELLEAITTWELAQRDLA